jgi:putative ABC transport system permease protein
MSVDPGFEPQNVLTVDIMLPPNKYDETRGATFFRQLLEHLRALPGVKSAGAAYPLPLSGGEEPAPFGIEGQPTAPGERRFAGIRRVSTDYFKTLSMRPQKGRVISEGDGADTPLVMVVNEAMARQYWPDQDPIGSRVTFDSRNGQSVWREIIGVVGDVRHTALDKEPRPEFYIPIAQSPVLFLTLAVRTVGPSMNLVAAVRDQVQALDKDLPISNVHTMEELLGRSVSQPRFNLALLAVFACVAMLLAAVGIYGVMSYLVTERTHEIGIRMALGAQARDVLKLVIREGMILALAGLALGAGAALGLTRLIKNLLFGVSTTDPLTFATIVTLLAGVALLACYIPARRATMVDPMIALSRE